MRPPIGDPSSTPEVTPPLRAAGPRPLPGRPPGPAPYPSLPSLQPAPFDPAPVPPLLADSPDPDEPFENGVVVARFAEPWMISLFVHLLLLVAAGLWLIPRALHPTIELEAIFAETLGEQLVDDTLQMVAEDEPAEEPVLTPPDLPPVSQPLAALPPISLPDIGDVLSSADPLPDVGMALQGREEGMRKALLKAFGGTAQTEQSVQMALQWLARQQQRNGEWSLTGPYTDGALTENSIAATAMALIAFQGAGHTHQAGSHKSAVARGSWALIRAQDSAGSFWPAQSSKHPPTNHRLYTHAMATIALSELYGMTQDPKLRNPAQRAIDYAVRVQDSAGGWRYVPGEDSDTSVTGWFVMALQSGRMAGLEVPSPTLMAVGDYLETVAYQGGARYAYHPGWAPTPVMTAEALLCRQYLGWDAADPRLNQGIAYIMAHRMDRFEPNVYYWYYATQVLHHMADDRWDDWNEDVRTILPDLQETKGKERGSWPPLEDRWGTQGGRLFVTCLACYTLEVYYRHLPIYQRPGASH